MMPVLRFVSSPFCQPASMTLVFPYLRCSGCVSRRSLWVPARMITSKLSASSYISCCRSGGATNGLKNSSAGEAVHVVAAMRASAQLCVSPHAV
eukprot:6105744-Pyramimonas_sp.AAC.1